MAFLDKTIVFFIPNTRWYNKRPWMQVPYVAAIITALIKEEFGLLMVDANVENLSEAQCLERLQQLQADMVLISGLSVEYYQQYHKSFEIAKLANPQCITLFGGVYPTLIPEDAMKDANIDYVMIGQAEDRLPALMRIILTQANDAIQRFDGIGYRNENGEACINPTRSFTKDVVKPDYSLLDVGTYVKHKSQDFLSNTIEGDNATIITSFGCPLNCSFCASRTISGRKVLFRPVEQVIEEMEFYIHEHGVRNFTIVDENFLANRKRVEAILNTFIDRNYQIIWQMGNVALWHLDDELLELMKRAGCTAISPSIESGDPHVLKNIIGKPLKILEKAPSVVAKCKELGINVAAHFVIGLPEETWEEIRQTFSFAESLDADLVVFHIATPYPKTELYEYAKTHHLLPENFSFFNPDFYGTSRGFITTKEFTPFELMVLRSFEWDRINFKTPEKTAKIAKMMNFTLEELNEHRKQTRLKCGVHY
ncbi:MAG: radical SAM protein [Methylococcaceae bacterium]|nr:MAG: radical SAM protein [Methylococcaceae bacterium]